MKALILKLARRRFSPSHNQSGMASMLVTGILISLIGLVAVGFAAVMRHEVAKSVNNQISQTAYDAAQSGINDAVSYLKTHPTTAATNCSDLTGVGKPLYSSSVLSSDGKTKYTCVLVNPNPSDLQYQAVGPQDSQVTRIDTSATMSSMVLSWQANDRALANYPTCTTSCPLYDESTWGNSKYVPMLRVTIYPVPAATQDPNLAYAKANAKTFFLYPTKDANNTVDSISYTAAATKSGLKAVGCGSTDLGTFVGSTSYNCNIKLTGFVTSSAYQYYVDLTPLYADTNIRIQANDANNTTVTFKNTQAIIDATAQSGAALKRLQARVDTSGQSGITEDVSAGSNGFSPFGLRSAQAICKRLEVPASGAVYTDINTDAICSSSIPPQSPPVVNTTYADTITSTSAIIHGSITPNNFAVTNCSFVYSKFQLPVTSPNPKIKLSTTKPCTQSPSSFGKGNLPKTASVKITGLTQGTKYHYALCATFKGYKQVCDYSNPSFTTLNPIQVNTGGLQTTPKLPTWGTTDSIKTFGDSVTDCWLEWDNDSQLNVYSITGTLTTNGHSNQLKCDQFSTLPRSDNFGVSTSTTVPAYNHDYYYELWAKYVDTDGATKWGHGAEYCFYALGKGSQPTAGNNYFNNHRGTDCQPQTTSDGSGSGSGSGDGNQPNCWVTVNNVDDGQNESLYMVGYGCFDAWSGTPTNIHGDGSDYYEIYQGPVQTQEPDSGSIVIQDTKYITWSGWNSLNGGTYDSRHFNSTPPLHGYAKNYFGEQFFTGCDAGNNCSTAKATKSW